MSREIMQQALDALKSTATRSAAEQYATEQNAIAALEAALAQPEQEKESTAQTVDPRLLLGRSNNFTKETENRLCDIERRMAAIETQPALAQPEQAMTPISQDQYERLCFTCGACIGKTWVGLTEGELIDIQNCNRGFWTNAAKIEQLLKDKNT